MSMDYTYKYRKISLYFCGVNYVHINGTAVRSMGAGDILKSSRAGEGRKYRKNKKGPPKNGKGRDNNAGVQFTPLRLVIYSSTDSISSLASLVPLLYATGLVAVAMS